MLAKSKSVFDRLPPRGQEFFRADGRSFTVERVQGLFYNGPGVRVTYREGGKPRGLIIYQRADEVWVEGTSADRERLIFGEVP